MSELKLMQHPEITELLSVLEQNGLHKEQDEVKCLAAYIDEMEGQLSAMNEELMQMHREISTIRDSSLKVRCEKLISGAEKQLRQAVTAIRTVKDNCLCMARNAMDTFKAVITTLNIAQKLLPFFSVPAYYGRFLGLFVLLAISWRTFLAHDSRKVRFICYISRNFLSTHAAAFPARKDNSKSRIRHRNHLRKVRCPPASWLPSFAARIQRHNEAANEFLQVHLAGA